MVIQKISNPIIILKNHKTLLAATYKDKRYYRIKDNCIVLPFNGNAFDLYKELDDNLLEEYWD